MKKIVLMLVLIGSAVTFTGCFGAAPAKSVTVSEEKIWPADLPNNVPKIDTEKISKVSTLINSTLIEAEGITQEEYTAYIDQVTQEGWTVLIDQSETSKAFQNGESRLDVTLQEDKLLIDYSKSTDTKKEAH